VSEYIYDNATWYNSNGSEAKRLFIYKDELWIPGGATNDKVIRLKIGDNTLSLLSIIDVGNTSYGGQDGINPYDIAEAKGVIYILSMNDFVFYGNYATLATGRGNFTTSATSHGCSIVSVIISSEPYLMVNCANVNKLEL
jgi:lipid-binding SYLF domain-containing protein